MGTIAMKRRRARVRCRNPRMLFTELGVVRPWSELHAQLLLNLGQDFLHSIEEVVPLRQEHCRIDPSLDGQAVAFSKFSHVHKDLNEAQLKARWDVCELAGLSRTVVLLLFPRKLAVCEISMQQASENTGSADDATTSGILEATQESAGKIFAHALKPMNTVVYGVEDLLEDAPETSEPCQGLQTLLELKYSDLSAIQSDGLAIKLLEKRSRKCHTLPLHAIPMKAIQGTSSNNSSDRIMKLRDAMIVGLQQSISREGVASWSVLSHVMRNESRIRKDRHVNEDFSLQKDKGAGHRVLEVSELERKDPFGEWKTPWLPVDRESSYRWVDVQGWRHPYLKQGMTREEIASEKKPPVEFNTMALDKMFKPVEGPKGEWRVDENRSTDPEGWSYGLSWNSSTWDDTPGFFNQLRIRRWHRTYE